MNRPTGRSPRRKQTPRFGVEPLEDRTLLSGLTLLPVASLSLAVSPAAPAGQAPSPVLAPSAANGLAAVQTHDAAGEATAFQPARSDAADVFPGGTVAPQVSGSPAVDLVRVTEAVRVDFDGQGLLQVAVRTQVSEVGPSGFDVQTPLAPTPDLVPYVSAGAGLNLGGDNGPGASLQAAGTSVPTDLGIPVGPALPAVSLGVTAAGQGVGVSAGEGNLASVALPGALAQATNAVPAAVPLPAGVDLRGAGLPAGSAQVVSVPPVLGVGVTGPVGVLAYGGPEAEAPVADRAAENAAPADEVPAAELGPDAGVLSLPALEVAPAPVGAAQPALVTGLPAGLPRADGLAGDGAARGLEVFPWAVVTAAAPTASSPVAVAAEAVNEELPVLREAGLADDFLPFDTEAAGAAARDLLNQLGRLGEKLVHSPVAAWVLALTVAVLAEEYVRRRVRRSDLEPVLAGVGDEPWDWRLGLGREDLADGI